jgi:transposase, IS6 family
MKRMFVSEATGSIWYRALDSSGTTIDIFLSAVRSADTAKALLSKSLSDRSHPQPRVINTDQAKFYPPAIRESKEEGFLRRRCRHRPVQYLNNILEQDHRAIEKRIRAKQHFQEFSCARRTIQGYETVHKIRKGQVRWVDIRVQARVVGMPRVGGLHHRYERCAV